MRTSCSHISDRSSEDKVIARKEELNNEIAEFKKYSAELSEVLQITQSGGGATLTWIQD